MAAHRTSSERVTTSAATYWIEEAVTVFPGPVLSVSHDRAFIRHFGVGTLELRDGALIWRRAEEYLTLGGANR